MHNIFFVIFFFSGLTGLVYESVWAQYLKQILGHAAYAQTIVLIIFMGGMALGSWLASRQSARLTEPLRAYAVVEGGIGLLGVIFHGVFLLAAAFLFDALLPAIDAPWLANAVKWSVAGLLILPQSVLLGTTFPLMSVGLIRLLPADSGRSLGMLYFTNSIGAVTGVLCAAFWLIPALGLPGSIIAAGLLNILLALAAWTASAQAGLRAAPIPARRDRAAASNLFIWAALVTGMASFFYEIGWIRMLSLVLGSTVQAFELMLAAFIAGLAFGGLWIRKRLDGIERLHRFAGVVQILMGTLALLTLPAYSLTYDAMAALLSALARSDGGYLLFNLASMSLAIGIMVPTTFMAGMTLPLFTQAVLRAGAGEGGVGRVYAANTVGAILGVMLAVHVFMLATGTKGVIIVGATLDLALGVLLIHLGVGRRSAQMWAGASLALLAVALVAFELDTRKSASGVYRHGVAQLPASHELLFYRDGKTATVAVVRNESGDLTIKTNGKPDAKLSPPDRPPSADEVTMVMAAALPLAMAPQARRVANIGMGSGLTTHVLLADPDIEIVETIEIEAAMIEGARAFGEQNARAYADPRSVIRIDDAKSFFSTHGRRYDIIISEPSNPWVSGVASLFSREFYAHIKRHLADDGVLVQWLQLYETNLANFASVLKALATEFPAYDIYSTDDANILIVARPRRSAQELDEGIFNEAAMQRHLDRVGLASVADLQARWLGGERQFELLLQTVAAPMNSDFHPFLEYAAPKSRFLGENLHALSRMRAAPVPALEMLAAAGWTPAGVSADAHAFAYAKNVERARQLAAAVTAGQSVDGLDEGLLFPLELARAAAVDCGAGSPPGLLLATHYYLAAYANPYLDARTAASLWNGIAPRDCTARWPENVSRWLVLHRAVAARDTAAMLAAAQAILDNGAALEDWQERYLELAMLAAAAVHADADSSTTAKYWLDRNSAGVHADPLLRMLALLALDAGRR